MERRSFLSVLFAPLLRRFLPAKPADLPVQSIPIMGSGRLAFTARVPFSFETILNDDLSALSDTPAIFGRMARKHEDQAIAAIFGRERT